MQVTVWVRNGGPVTTVDFEEPGQGPASPGSPSTGVDPVPSAPPGPGMVRNGMADSPHALATSEYVYRDI